MKLLPILLLFLLLTNCKTEKVELLSDVVNDTSNISGNKAYLQSPYVTAGHRLYMVGYQDGTFPDIGWHIKGEMGGIWNHPIKLMDGFDASLTIDENKLALNKAIEFVNYPFANKHLFSFPDKEIEIERWQFVPTNEQGVFIQFVLKNTSKKTQKGTFEFIGHTDLQPTWLGERTQMINGKDNAKFNPNINAWEIKDDNNPWHVIYGANMPNSNSSTLDTTEQKNTVSNSLSYDIQIPTGNTTLNFVIAGSYKSKGDALDSYQKIHTEHQTLAKEKKAFYQNIQAQTKLTIPDKELEQTFEWLKYNCDWLVRTVPELGTTIGAGIPDYPWLFGVDSEYALKGYMMIGQDDIVHQTIHLLDSVSMALNGNGKIIHEMSTNGAVFNPGNINETPQFASLIWDIYRWNGDKAFLEKYFTTISKGLHWLMTENDANENLFPDGFGMMEIHGLDSEMIDVAAYTQRGFEDASKIAAELGNQKLKEEYNSVSLQLKDKINTEFWSEDFSSYADFLGTDKQALHLIEDAIVRADTLNKPWAIEELEQTKNQILTNPSKNLKPFVLHHNWVVNTPLEMGIADSAKAITALNTAKKFTNPFGTFVTGIDRDASAGKDDGSFQGSKVFSYTGAVMTLPTGVSAIAENNYGRPDEALDYLKRMTRTFSYALPGSMYEVSPDYGMLVQAWNIYAFAVPIVQQFFGINPMASEKKIRIQPQMPSAWDTASLENVKIADNTISIVYKNKDGKLTLEILQTNPDWNLEIVLPKGEYQIIEGTANEKVEFNSISFSSSSKKIVLSSH